MHPTHSLPENYALAREVDLSKDTPLLVKLNIIGLVLFVAFFELFSWLAVFLNPEYSRGSLWTGRLEINLSTIVLIILAFGLVLILHEAVHGLFFWIFTGARPRFGLKAAYAYAAAPDWYIPRNPYLVIGSAPLVVISLLGVALLPVIPSQLILPWLFLLTTNASGAVGDLYIVGWLLTQPPGTLIQDRGDGMAIYVPRAASPTGHSRRAVSPDTDEEPGD